jgi:hypothetical protein
MRNTSLLANIFLLAGIALLVAGGVSWLAEQASARNPLKVEFVDPASLTKLQSLSTNRLALRIQNPTSSPARIVGNNAC